MKKVKCFLIVGWGIGAALAGCQLLHPGEPRLISPKNNEVFDSLPPTFVWHKEDVSEYYLMAFKDSLWSKDTLCWDTLTDTTYTISKNAFYSADSGIYKWTVAVRDTASGELLYPSPRSISIGEFYYAIDLDTTCFPFGLGYEWCYECYSYAYHLDPNKDDVWLDTITIKVLDSVSSDGGLRFKLNDFSFEDLGERPLFIDADVQLTWNHYYVDSMLIPISPETKKYSKENVTIAVDFLMDTLSIAIVEPGDFYYNGDLKKTAQRVKGIGAICLTDSNWFGQVHGNVTIKRLLWFYNGKDTVFKAKDWGEVIDVDLDTTYFPMGLDYEWKYQRHSWGKQTSGDSSIAWDYYDTFTVSVADSFWEGKTMMMRFASDSGKPFRDLGNPTKVMDGKVLVQRWGGITPWVNPCKPEGKSHMGISYSGDTLNLSHVESSYDGNYNTFHEEWTKRLRGIGLMHQESAYSFYSPISEEESNTSDSLIRFTTPEGQVWP